MNKAYISIGSNIGKRHVYLKEAIELLERNAHVAVGKVSSIYETEPVGFTEQASFLNVVVSVTTEKSAEELLTICQEIEQQLGRERTIRWGPRTVDLDILLYNEEVIDTERLIVPHPRMHERAFVLIPLIEVAPNIASPISGKLYANEAAVQHEGVQIWQE